MSAAALLSRLDRVKSTGANKWIARCPAHADKGPSLAIRELDDGRVLVHDFAGCSVSEILAAVGMELSDLYPPKPTPPGQGKPHRERRPFTGEQLLHVLAFESKLVQRAALGLLRGEIPTEADVERLRVAAERFEEGVRYART